ncbi:MAG: hypothetical protein QOE93_273 [Actinomycetota bacterium]|nr:hypothetical protein [Actinomycetota bacterium]
MVNIRRRRWAGTAFAFALLLLAGVSAACGGGDDDASPSTSAPLSTADPATTVPIPEEPVVTLDDPGANPRRLLVLRVKPGTTTTSAVVSRVGVDLTIDGELLPTGVVPGTRMVLTHRVDTVDPDGSVHYTITVTDAMAEDTPGADPDVVAEVHRAVQQLVGLEGIGSVDGHGGHVTASFDTAGIRNRSLRETLDSVSSQVAGLAAPFPVEPVGVGARWTVTSTATIAGITMDLSTTYTLRAAFGATYELDVVQDGDAPPGPAAIPNLAAGTTATVERFTLHGTGRVTGDFTHVLPSESTLDGTGDAAFVISTSTADRRAEEHITIGYALSPG